MGIQLTRLLFFQGPAGAANLHADAYFSKVEAFALQRGLELRSTLPDHGRNGPGLHRKFKNAVPGTGGADAPGQRPRQLSANRGGKRFFLFEARRPRRKLRIALENTRNRL